MQMPTHLIAGVLIDEAVKKTVLPAKSKNILILLLNLFSHGLLDGLSKATYHPPEPLPKDLFWVVYHKLILPALSITILFKFWKEHKLSMIFSLIPDLDWIVRAVNSTYGNIFSFWNKPILNQGVLSLVTNLPFFKWINSLPDWRKIKVTVVLEGILILIISFFVWLLKSRRK